MKQIFYAFLLMVFGTSFGQVQKLGELSSGIFIDSSVIMEEDESDVFGYCLLYESDRKSKEVYELEYVILDKNLNKLTSITLNQAVFKTWMARTRTELTFVKKIGNQLTIGINDRLKNLGEFDFHPFFNYRFINLNLESFKFSKEFKYEGFTKKEFQYKAGDKMEFDDFWYLQKLTKTKSGYLISFAAPEYNPKAAMMSSMETFDYKREQSVKKFAILDQNLNIVWSKDINADKKTACKYSYLDSDRDVLLIKKETLVNKTVLESYSIEAYDITTGKMLGEMVIDDKNFNIKLFSCSITANDIHIFTNTYEKSKKARSQGYGHLVYNKQTIAETGRSFLLWKNLTAQIPGVNEFGQLEKDNYLFAQDFIVTPKGNTLMVLEAYTTKGAGNPFSNTQKSFAILKDMYLIESTPDNTISFSKKIEKENSVEIPAGLHPRYMREYGVFDYIFCQKINKGGDFVMFYTSNDQEGTSRKMAKKPLWTLGIVSNAGGEYGFEKFPLYGDDVKIYPALAKNGYIRLLELNYKTHQAEMRLEKINY